MKTVNMDLVEIFEENNFWVAQLPNTLSHKSYGVVLPFLRFYGASSVSVYEQAFSFLRGKK